MPTPTTVGAATARAATGTMVRQLSRLSNMLSRERLEAWTRQGATHVQSLTRRARGTYQTGRLLLLGPVRNAGLVAREMVRLVGREREWPAARSLPSLTCLAVREYQQLWRNTLERIRSVDTLRDHLRRTSWGQVGGTILVLGEVLSLYYLGKLLTRGTKRTVGLIT